MTSTSPFAIQSLENILQELWTVFHMEQWSKGTLKYEAFNPGQALHSAAAMTLYCSPLHQINIMRSFFTNLPKLSLQWLRPHWLFDRVKFACFWFKVIIVRGFDKIQFYWTSQKVYVDNHFLSSAIWKVNELSSCWIIPNWFFGLCVLLKYKPSLNYSVDKVNVS